MTKLFQTTCRAAVIAAVALTAAPALAAPTGVVAPNEPAVARARIVKPLTLEALSDMEFGDIVVNGSGTATLANTGTLTCTATNLVCGATGTAAQYRVRGTNNQIVYITKPDVTLTNTVNPGTDLTLVLSGPTQVLLPNSGSTGETFNLGGSIAISESTLEGAYSGILAVTVDYQ